MDKYLQTLELDLILEQVAAFAQIDTTRAALFACRPLATLADAAAELAVTDSARLAQVKAGAFSFGYREDPRELFSRAGKGGLLREQDLLVVINFLKAGQAAAKYGAGLVKLGVAAVAELWQDLPLVPALFGELTRCLNEYGEIQDGASSELKRLRRKLAQTAKNLEARLAEELAKNLDRLSQNSLFFRNDRYVLAVKAEYKNKVKGIVHDRSSSGETVFIEPEAIAHLNNQIAELKAAEARESLRILTELSLAVGAEEAALTALAARLGRLDYLQAKAAYALKIGATAPKLTTSGRVYLKDCFHPLLNVPVIVKNTVTLSSSRRGMVITGPNTGGKTLLLKTIGLLTVMAQAGLLIPAQAESELHFFRGVYADIGDEQSIEQNLSTFSGHLANIIAICAVAGPDALVLLDELGSGTDPAEGAALALAIFDYLHKSGAYVVATTHYSDLKLYAYQNPGIDNASVTFDQTTLKPTYRLLQGVPGTSNALKIAATLGLAPEIIARAAEKLARNTDEAGDIIARLTTKAEELAAETEALATRRAQVTAEGAALAAERAALERTRQQLRSEITAELEAEIAPVAEKAAALLDKLAAAQDATLKAHEISALKHELKTLTKENRPAARPAREFAVGDFVWLPAYQKTFEVVKVGKDRLTVAAGSFKLVVAKSAAEPAEPEAAPEILTGVLPDLAVAPSRIDLRGLRYEDAADRLAEGLDAAVLGNLAEVVIIHGFGTGALRTLVQKTLKSRRDIAKVRSGGAAEGGAGVTIAEFKK